MKLSAVPLGQYQKVLIYGDAKTGKSRMVGRLAKDFKLNWLDLENGHEVLLKDDNLLPEYRDNITLFKVQDNPMHPIAFETIFKLFSKEPSISLCHNHGKIACPHCDKATFGKLSIWNQPQDTILVIDSLTQFTNSCLSYITRTMPTEYKLQRDDYGTMKRYVDIVTSFLQNAPINIVCISHLTEAQAEDGRTTKIMPVMGSSSSSAQIAKAFGHVLYAEKVGKNHVVGSSTTYGMNLVTGSRTNVKTETTAADVYSPMSVIFGKKG